MSALLILQLDQLATLAGPYYYCFYLFIFLSHVCHPLPGGAGEQDERQRTWQLFSGEVSVRKNLLPSPVLKRWLENQLEHESQGRRIA